MKLDLTVAGAAAQEAASVAQDIIREFTGSGNWSVSFKADDTPVTEVDVAVEHAIRKVLAEAFPLAGFYGEETGKSTTGESAPDLRWLVDPIDGTKSFIRGMPFYSTQIALEYNGELCVGVSNAPAYGERLVAVAGRGVELNGKAVRSSAVRSINDAFLSSGNLTRLAADEKRWQRYGALVSRARRVRGYGDFCHYHQLCCGQTDLIIESDVNILDIAALTVGVRESGGVMTDLDGKDVDESTTSVLAACTAELHGEVLNMLGTRDNRVA